MKAVHFNHANCLTISRIVLIPIFVMCFYLPVSWHYLAADIVFSIAALTDYVDGYYARKLKQASAFGKFLDPVADKLMVAVALIVLLADQPAMLLTIATVIIVSREIFISALREWMAELGEQDKVNVSVYGKWKTVCQSVALIFLIFHDPLFGLPIYQIGMVLLYISVVMTLWSMLLYINAAAGRG